jgi:aspartate/methionine/tyrosine aminotransferase
MNSIAEELNKVLEGTIISDLLSDLGRRAYFPRGIVAQTSEAAQHATRFNATVGMAFHQGQPMYLNEIRSRLPDLEPRDIFAYSTTSGEPELRKLWKAEMERKNPSLSASTSVPLVTSGLTHALMIAADLFIEPGDTVVLPDLFWGNYRLIMEERRKAKLLTFPFFDDRGGLNVKGVEEALKSSPAGKAILLLNFPNNPTGYSPSRAEAEQLKELLGQIAEKGKQLLIIMDDAYFGLFYEDEIYRESLFGPLADQSSNILAVKADGATKEELTWGFRIGFLTFASKDLSAEHYGALEKKAMGLIRSSISNASRPAQSLLIRGLKSGTHDEEKARSHQLMKERYIKVRDILEKSSPPPFLKALPFNSGYFMCFSTSPVNAEDLRKKLLYEEGVGTISVGEKYLRVAFSMPDIEDLDGLYDTIFKTASSMK